MSLTQESICVAQKFYEWKWRSSRQDRTRKCKLTLNRYFPLIDLILKPQTSCCFIHFLMSTYLMPKYNDGSWGLCPRCHTCVLTHYLDKSEEFLFKSIIHHFQKFKIQNASNNIKKLKAWPHKYHAVSAVKAKTTYTLWRFNPCSSLSRDFDSCANHEQKG